MPTAGFDPARLLAALRTLPDQPLRAAATDLFTVLGYESSRALAVDSLAQLRELLDPHGALTEENALLSRWRSVHLLFQLTKAEIRAGSGGQLDLELAAAWEPKDVQSYVFFALDLAPRPGGSDVPTRTELGRITRALNRLIPMPVLVLFRHGHTASLAVINRRKNLRDGTRDILTRVSLIRDVCCPAPHRAHLDLLARFSLHRLREEHGALRTFADLDSAWQRLLDTRELNQRFYGELSAWFRWAIGEIRLARLPDHTEDTAPKRNRATQEFTVRLICRTLFAWFLKEMGLVPGELLELFDVADRPRALTRGGEGNDFRAFLDDGNQYYRGILQNVFFQALNRPMDARRKPGPAAAADVTVADPAKKRLAYLGKNQLPDGFDYDLFDRIPYLNGGLFDALPEDNASDTIEDGPLRVPNKLFYARREDGYLPPNAGRRGAAPVEGLNRIFSRYSFTVEENTPLEEDVALDPELLGLVFENLLAEIDPADPRAAESARKASGSYYTPRRIVEYMVNEALHLHLRTGFERAGAEREDLQLLTRLCYDLGGAAADFSPIAERVVDALDALRVLDPACGSGAFPMGMLHRMVALLARVDPANERWKRRLLARLPAPMRADAERGMAGKRYDYLRKLGLIQKNLYGLDIQPLAALIAKLRFFLTLVIEQDLRPADRAANYGLQPLPNLETNLLCCDTLHDADHGLLSGPVLQALRDAREEYYQPATSRERRDALARAIGEQLATLFPGFARRAKGIVATGATALDRANVSRAQDAACLAEWFKHATVAAPFFNVETFFPELVAPPAATLGGEFAFLGESGGQTELTPPSPRRPAPFHIVIGNPPYGGDKIPDDLKTGLGLGSKDIYGAFLARFLGDPDRPSPLAADGVLAFIVSDTFMTIKTHRPLRQQMLRHRVHKMIRVAPDTFGATVNCAVVLAQRGPAPAEHVCQMADLTNVSVHGQYEYFLHLLYQTEGTGPIGRRQNVSNQTYAIYHYRQGLIGTNSNLPFFVASPKLFALMNDTTAPAQPESVGGSQVSVRAISFNGQTVRLVKLGDVAEVKVGLQTGDNENYLFQNPTAHGSYRSIAGHLNHLLNEDDLARIHSDEQLRRSIVKEGITKSDTESARYFGGKYIVPYDKGGESDSDEGFMPNYWVATDYFIDWSEWAVNRMKSLTLREKLRQQGEAGGNDKLTSRFQNQDSYFVPGLTWSDAGVYSPTIRFSGRGVFDVKGSRFITAEAILSQVLGIVCSKLCKMWIKAIGNHSVSTQSDNIRDLIIPTEPQQQVAELVQTIVNKQKTTPRYDYASNEQREIDRLVYAAYGLNEADVREVEDWYVRRYPKLATAQRRALAAKEGRSEEDQLLARPVRHLFCDESRHLPHDREPFLLLGLTECPADQVRACHLELRAIWRKHGLPDHWEAKWAKVSPAKAAFYHDVFDWFFGAERVAFRALVLPDKAALYSRLPEATRDSLYYRLYYQLIRGALDRESRHRVFLDLKDTRGREKVRELASLLRRDLPDAAGRALEGVQEMRSHEARLLQVTDLLLGAVGYARGGFGTSTAKTGLVRAFEERLGQPLTADTPAGHAKVSVLTWHDPDALLL